MQRSNRNNGAGEDASASAEQQPVGDSSPAGNTLTRLLEEVARRVSFSEDAAFYVAGASGKILFISAGYSRIAGALPENGQISSAIFQFISNNGESYVRDEVIRTDSGAPPRYVRSYHYPMHDNSGALLGIAGHYVETTDQVAAMAKSVQQASLRQDQLRASSDLFWELDTQGELIALSDRASAILGKPAIVFHGRRLGAIGRFIERSGADAPEPQGFSIRQPFRDAIFLMRGENDEPHYFHMSAVPVFDPVSGTFQGFRGAGVNVTARFQAEDMAAAAQRELELARESLLQRNIQLDIERSRAEKALRVKSEFLATMSHELRTPLNAILGFSETMAMGLFGPLSAQYASYAGDILKSGRHLLSLIEAMLESARVDGGEVSLNLQQLDISELIAQAVRIVQLRAGAKNLDMSKAAVQPGWVVKCDPLLTMQILVNLLSNAVKFTNANGAIGVEISADVHGGAAVAGITVWDTGIGVPTAMQSRIFDKFVRGDNAIDYDDSGQGIGLGLHISKRLAELMQGGIHLQSVPGNGSRFTLDLPLISTP